MGTSTSVRETGWWTPGDPCEVYDAWASRWCWAVVDAAMDSRGEQVVYAWLLDDNAPGAAVTDQRRVGSTRHGTVRTRSAPDGWRAGDRGELWRWTPDPVGGGWDWWPFTVRSVGTCEDGPPDCAAWLDFDDPSSVWGASTVLDLSVAETRERLRPVVEHIGGVPVCDAMAVGALMAALGHAAGPTSRVADLTVAQVRCALRGLARVSSTRGDGP